MRYVYLSVLTALLAATSVASAQPLPPIPLRTPADETPTAAGEEPSSQSTEDLTRELLALEESLRSLEGDLDQAQTNPALSRRQIERQAFEELTETGTAPVLARPTGVVHPFGQSVPTLTCAPDRACDLELEAGEEIDGLALGATDRWEVTQFFEGAGELTPHVLLKPSEFGLKTNLVVVTNRRTYHLELASIEKESETEPAYHHHMAFWYPQQWAQRVRSEEEASEKPAQPEPVAQPFDAGDLNFAYEVDPPRRKKRRLPWRPRAVFDDGERIFIKLPAAARPLPAVVGRQVDGSPLPVNEQFRGDTFVIPTLVEELELVSGSGKARRWLTIRRLTPPGSSR